MKISNLLVAIAVITFLIAPGVTLGLGQNEKVWNLSQPAGAPPLFQTWVETIKIEPAQDELSAYVFDRTSGDSIKVNDTINNTVKEFVHCQAPERQPLKSTCTKTLISTLQNLGWIFPEDETAAEKLIDFNSFTMGGQAVKLVGIKYGNDVVAFEFRETEYELLKTIKFTPDNS